MDIEPCSIELKCLTLVYQVLFFQKLSIGIQLQLVTYASHLQIGTFKVNKLNPPGGMQGSKFIQLISLSIPYNF